MAGVIRWLQRQEIADYTMENGSLSQVDAQTEAARLQRIKFYTAFGFQLVDTLGALAGAYVH